MKIFVISLLALLIGVPTFTKATRSPVFSQNSYSIQVYENVKGTFVTSIKDKVSDPDFNTVLEYYYSGPDYRRFFLKDGDLFFNVDYFLGGLYPRNVSLVMSAADRTGLTASAALDIEILPVVVNLPTTTVLPIITTTDITLFTMDTTVTTDNTVTMDTTDTMDTMLTDSTDTSIAISTVDFSMETTTRPPVFSLNSYTIKVPENVNGTFVTSIKDKVNDPDFNTILEFYYSGSNYTLFVLKDGDLFFNVDYFLDGSLPKNVSLVVNAADRTGLTASAAFHIEILDVNQPPVLHNLPSSVEIPEITNPGIKLFTIIATDRDRNTTLIYGMKPSTAVSAADFEIDTTTGIITLVTGNIMDYDSSSVKNFTIEITVSDQSVTSTSTLTVTVTNVNEPPVFASSFNGNVTIPEGKAGQIVLRDIKNNVTDPESNVVTFDLQTGLHTEKFSIDQSSGTITYATDYNVDPAGLPGQVTLVVLAKDSTGLSSSVTMAIEILNANQAPKFNNLPGTFIVDENTAPLEDVFILNATDPDSIDPLTITVTVPVTEFTLSGDVLSVSSTAKLNYEVETSYTMTFQVSDGVLTDTQTLIINIKNVAEAPVFSQTSPYSVTMDESMKGTKLTTLSDKITDDDGQTTFDYTLTGTDADKFIVNNGKIFFNVDYYVGAFPAKPDLGVEARDSSGLTATATFDVTIDDINQAPVFTNLPNSNQLQEIVDPGTILFNASVKDPDQADTITIGYNINTLKPSGIEPADFSLDPTTGVITLVTGNVLDFEASNTKAFTIELTASDGTLTDTGTLTITVTNKNEPPIFNSTWTQTVSAPEGKMGDIVYSDLSSVVTDPEGDIIRYSFQTIPNPDKFNIHPFSGIITYKEDYDVDPDDPLPPRLPSVVQLTVAALDPSSLSSTATITINIIHLNQPPKWTNLPATINVNENEAAGKTVITFNASDPDTGDLPVLVFSKLGGTTDFVVLGANLNVVSIDFETKQTHTLTIQVTDRSGATDNQTLTINIVDVPEPPVFQQPNYMFTIPEGVKGTIVASISDKFTDGDNDTAFTYTLSGADASKFTVSNNGSILYGVDYYLGASPATATITVTVTDPDFLTATTDLFFTITNVNQPPYFTNLPNSTTVPEIVTLPHLLFTALASDLDSADILTYAMDVSGPVSAADFTLNPSTGVITLATGNVMDFDASITKSFTINMTVTDSTSTGTGTLTVTVTNVNEPPIFNSSWTKSENVMEGKMGQTVYNNLQNVVYDPEGDSIIYDIQPGPDSEKFIINPSTGLISYKVDYDTDPSQTNFPNMVVLTIEAKDSNLTTTDTLTLNIQSVNQPPEFTKLPTSVNIPEDTTASSVVFTFAATDADSADVPSYSLLNGGGEFAVSGSDLIVSNSVTLDYETTTSYILEMQVSDGKSTDNKTLTINIQNVDEPPMFEQNTYTLNIPEAKMGTVVISPLSDYNVSDPEKQALTFNISGPDADKFQIDSATGVVSYAVDYFLGASGLPNTLSLVVSASDTSSMSSSTTLTITIQDLDQPPQFTNLPANASLLEDVPIATSIHTVQGSDPDGKPITIKLLNSLPTNDFFDFNSATNMVTTKTLLDYEQPNKQFELTFTVEDAMTTSTATLTIIIKNVNEPPTFTQTSFTLTLEEGNMGTTVFQSAPNVNDPEKQPLNYSITTGTDSDKFQINPTTGVVSYAVNYYLGGTPGLPASVSLVVVATDPMSLTSSTTLDITVSDVNQPPQITNLPPVLYVRENVTLNTLVYTINATDNDGEAIRFTELFTWPENTGILFGIDRSSGEIRTTSPLDYEASYKQLRIIFTAADSTSTSTSTLTINIVDVNEPPTFSQASYTVTVPEGKAQSKIIPSLRVYVTDPESPTESISFIINPSIHSNKFTIDRNTGSLVYAVDYDVDDSQYPSSVSLSVSATDPFFLSGTATFNINIVHVNNAPILTNLPKNVLISEDAASGTSVFTASARDDDPGDTLTFSIERSTSTVLSLFQIDPTSGQITTKSTNGKMLDFETMQNSLNIQVTVKDGSGDSVTRTLAITLSNVNEPPQFSPTLRVFSVAEGKAGTQVTPGFSSSVMDPEGGTVNFRLVSGPNSDKFRIDQNTGTISFASDYDADPARSPSNVNLVVMAVDSSSLSSSVTVNIQIQNVNQPPKFTNLPQSVSVVDTSSPGTVIFTASASDQDTDDTLSFSLSPRNAQNLVNYLDINVRNGEIILLNSLTSAGSSLQYDVKVSDGTAAIQDILSINIVNTAVATTTTKTGVATQNSNQPGNAAKSTDDDDIPIATILLIVAIVAVALFAIGIGVYCYKTKCAPPKKRRRRRDEKRHQPKLYQVSPRYGPPTPRNDDIYRDYYYNYS